MSFFQWTRIVANFVDSDFKTVDSVIIGHNYGFKGMKKNTFRYKEGIYNINPKAFKVQTAIKSHLFFDDDIYIYQIGNPDPLFFDNNEFKPFMSAEVYKSRLENKLVVDLNSIAMGGPDWKTILKYLLLGAVVIIILYYLFGKGTTTNTETISTVSALVSNNNHSIKILNNSISGLR